VENTGLLGRWQVLSVEPRTIADTAHNSEGLALVLAQLKKEKYNQLWCVLGFVKEKNLDQILPLFPKEARYLYCRPDIPRGMGEDYLEMKAREHGLSGKKYGSVAKALEAAKNNAEKEDLIFVGGSNFTVAEVV
jgi:dihydrofolate synthase/folylpolyglutamate synthase